MCFRWVRRAEWHNTTGRQASFECAYPEHEILEEAPLGSVILYNVRGRGVRRHRSLHRESHLLRASCESRGSYSVMWSASEVKLFLAIN
jgi:hypothetical protein